MQNNLTPILSVILPVYNAERYIRASLDSVLNQSFSDFELIVINDGSTDNSGTIIRTYKDPRIKYFEQENAGLAETLNRGIQLSQGELIARQDNDDVSAPERFEKQVSFMRNHDDVMLLGTGADIIDENGNKTGRSLIHFAESPRLKFHLIFNNYFVHSSVVFRKKVLEETGLYIKSDNFFEDHNLWSRIARVAKVHNLPEKLLLYREVGTSMSRTSLDYLEKVINQGVENILFYCPDLQRGEAESCARCVIGTADFSHYAELRRAMQLVLNKLATAFAAKENIDPEIVRKECEQLFVSFRRHYYNYLIQEPDVPVIRKLIYKIKRRILYLRYTEHF